MHEFQTNKFPGFFLYRDVAPQSLLCGFSLWNQSYNNCRDGAVTVYASAYESATRKAFILTYCFEPGQTQVPFAPWGMLVYSVGEFDTESC